MDPNISIISKVKKLIETARIPADAAVPSGINEAELHGFVQRTGIDLPAPLCEFLKLKNGSLAGQGGLFGIRPDYPNLDIETKFQLFPKWKEKKWIPIAGDGCGNYYVLATQQEHGTGFPVLFIDTIASPLNPAYIVASDLWILLWLMLEAERTRTHSWPFDKAFTLRQDPDLARLHGAPLPWQAD